MRWLALLLLMLAACSDGDRTVIVRNDIIEELPSYVAGDYWLGSFRVGDVESLSRSVVGRLHLGEDGEFSMRLRRSDRNWRLVGFYDVRSGLLVVFRTSEFIDVLEVYQYDYSRGAVTLQWFDGLLGVRYVAHWSRLPDEIYPYD